MFIPHLVFIAAIVFSNSLLAKQKGKSVPLWTFISIVSFLAAELLLGSMFIGSIYHGPADPKELESFMIAHPLSIWTMLFLGVGGGLVIRFVLEKMDTPKDNTHWMDKLGKPEEDR